ncbi:unnamed protein product, partial [marine sediment metagenome]
MFLGKLSASTTGVPEVFRKETNPRDSYSTVNHRNIDEMVFAIVIKPKVFAVIDIAPGNDETLVGYPNDAVDYVSSI